MSQQSDFNDPVVRRAVLEHLSTYTRQDLLDKLEQFETEKPGDIVLPGVKVRSQSSDEMPRISQRRLKKARRDRVAA